MADIQARKIKLNIKSENGFSIIELSFVLAILAILSYVAVSELTTSSSLIKEKSLAQKIMSDVRYAQEMALSHRQEVRFDVNADNNSYSLKWADNTCLKTPIGEQDFIFNLGSSEFAGVNITSSGFSAGLLNFDSSGKPENNGSTLSAITTLMTLNGSVVIKIVPGTGLCYIQE